MGSIVYTMNLGSMIGGIIAILSIPVIIWNLLICFLGYKLFRIQLIVMGFFFGSAIGWPLGALMGGPMIGRLLGLVLGVLTAWLAYKVYLAGVFLCVCLSSTSIFTLLFSFISGSFHSATVLVSLLLGIVLGVVCVLYNQAIIIFYTAITGGMSTGLILALVLANPFLGIVIGIVLSVMGAWLQFRLEQKGEGWLSPGSTLGAEKPAADYSSLVSDIKHSITQSTKDIASFVNSKKSHKENRNPNQTVLVSRKADHWIKSMPLLVSEIQIASQEGAEERVFLNLAVQNLTADPIVGIYFDVSCCDLLKNQLEGVSNAVFQDLNILWGETWFSSKSVPLPDPSTRSCVVTIQSVIFENGEIWKNEANAPLSQLPSPTDIALSPELAGEFYLEIQEHLKARNAKGLYRFTPQQESEYWRCSCGQHNIADTCASCGLEKDFLFSIFDESRLQQQSEQRASERLQAMDERQKHMDDQTEAIRQKSRDAMENIKNETNSVVAKTKAALRPLINRGKEHKKASILVGGITCVVIIALITGLSIYNSDYNRFFRAIQKDNYAEARHIYQSAKGNALEKIQNQILDNAKSIENQFKKKDIDFEQADSSLNHLLESTTNMGFGLFGSTDKTVSKLLETQDNVSRLNDSRTAFAEGQQKLKEKEYSGAVACFSSVIEEDENYKAAQANLKKATQNQALLAMRNKITNTVSNCGPLQSQSPRTPEINQGKNDLIDVSLIQIDKENHYGLLISAYNSSYFTPTVSTTFYVWANGRLMAAWSDAFSYWYPYESLESAQDSDGNFMLLNGVKGSASDFLKQRNDYIQFQPDGTDDTKTFECVGDPTGDTYTVDGTSVSKDEWDTQQKTYTDLKWTPIVSTDGSDNSKAVVHIDSKKTVDDTLSKLDQLME